MQGVASSDTTQDMITPFLFLNTHAEMRERDAQCLQGEDVSLQVLALPAWLTSLSVRGGLGERGERGH